MAFFYGLSSAHGHKVFVASCDIALEVSTGWPNTELKGTFQATLFFVAVFLYTIIKFNNSEVCVLAVLFKPSYTFLIVLFELDEELDVWRL